MKYTAKQYAQGLYEATEELGDKEALQIIKNFISFLEKNYDLGMLDSIIVEFKDLYDKKHDIKKVFIESARQLSEESKKEIIELLQKLINKKIILQENVNFEVLGGVKMRIDDLLIDGSIKKRISDLQKILK